MENESIAVREFVGVAKGIVFALMCAFFAGFFTWAVLTG